MRHAFGSPEVRIHVPFLMDCFSLFTRDLTISIVTIWYEQRTVFLSTALFKDIYIIWFRDELLDISKMQDFHLQKLLFEWFTLTYTLKMS